MSTRIGVRELRASLADHVQRAGAGERIIVTIAGKPIAQLGPPSPGPGAPSLAELAAAGLIDAPRRSPLLANAGEDLPVDVRLDRVMEELRGR